MENVDKIIGLLERQLKNGIVEKTEYKGLRGGTGKVTVYTPSPHSIDAYTTIVLEEGASMGYICPYEVIMGNVSYELLPNESFGVGGFCKNIAKGKSIIRFAKE